MAVDTPARIAILGAGPIGLEAALYARFLGYDVDVFEQGEVAANVKAWGHVRLFSPFGMNCSPLAVAALDSHGEASTLPAADAIITGHEYRERFLLPLAGTDLLEDCVRTHTAVLGVTKAGPTKRELVGDEERGDWDFRILSRDSMGRERISRADVVFDTTGSYGQPNFLGQGGIPALGEIAAQSYINYRLPNLQSAARDRFAGKRVLVVGQGYSAATAIVDLADLAKAVPETQITWVTAQAGPPLGRIPEDKLLERDRLAAAANALATAGGGAVTHIPEMTVHAVQYDSASDQFTVELAGLQKQKPKLEVDRILALVGTRPDLALTRELQVHTCYATEGPMRLAATLAKQATADCLSIGGSGPQALVTTEAHFYCLGAKSYGRDSRFLIATGLEQIRDVFTIIGDRPDLNLYATAGRMLEE